jgi:hypothetical protein
MVDLLVDVVQTIAILGLFYMLHKKEKNFKLLLDYTNLVAKNPVKARKSRLKLD